MTLQKPLFWNFWGPWGLHGGSGDLFLTRMNQFWPSGVPKYQISIPCLFLENFRFFFEKLVFGIPGVFRLGDFSWDHPRQKSVCRTSFSSPGSPMGPSYDRFYFFFPARGRFSGANFFRMTEYFLKSPFSGFLGFSGLEILHATILVKNQYVEPLFRLLRARWGSTYDRFYFFFRPGDDFLGRDFWTRGSCILGGWDPLKCTIFPCILGGMDPPKMHSSFLGKWTWTYQNEYF